MEEFEILQTRRLLKEFSESKEYKDWISLDAIILGCVLDVYGDCSTLVVFHMPLAENLDVDLSKKEIEYETTHGRATRFFKSTNGKWHASVDYDGIPLSKMLEIVVTDYNTPFTCWRPLK